ncbi:hypothetical protein NEOLEDRAFT_1119579 [Neolentinus lepideus HHB14362 ss-1]|uniref:L-type lectin-like domain-containing protein n=1 Tax=Neolentinus lepideus HHB14362 ss-1 TaxID=1314782 RepID=A0A165QJC7_9AGAM|nr:hypothetical protein NEOLEDRAFT_1119579 [Neolentinus lepideus HHB14362 ss-1]
MLCRILFYVALLVVGVLGADDNGRVANRTIERTVQLRTHSIYAPYIDQDLQNRWWDFGADAIVNTNKHIRLTRNQPSEMGWLWTRLPLTASNYVIEVEFKISGESAHLYGDGMAIWLTKGRAEPGPVFGSIDKFEGLALFLDTYPNARHSYSFPRVVAMMGDGKTEYDHDNDGDSTSIGACSLSFRRTNVATKLRLTYFKDEYLDVKVQYRAWDEWTDCFTLTDVSIPPSPFLGFSALTGAVSDNHDIIAVTTSSAILSPQDKPRDKLRASFFGRGRKGGSSPSDSSSWSWFFVKLFLFVGACAGGWFGWQQYQRRQRYGGFGGGMGMGLGGGRSGFGGAFYDSKRF